MASPRMCEVGDQKVQRPCGRRKPTRCGISSSQHKLCGCWVNPGLCGQGQEQQAHEVVIVTGWGDGGCLDGGGGRLSSWVFLQGKSRNGEWGECRRLQRWVAVAGCGCYYLQWHSEMNMSLPSQHPTQGQGTGRARWTSAHSGPGGIFPMLSPHHTSNMTPASTTPPCGPSCMAMSHGKEGANAGEWPKVGWLLATIAARQAGSTLTVMGHCQVVCTCCEFKAPQSYRRDWKCEFVCETTCFKMLATNSIIITTITTAAVAQMKYTLKPATCFQGRPSIGACGLQFQDCSSPGPEPWLGHRPPIR